MNIKSNYPKTTLNVTIDVMKKFVTGSIAIYNIERPHFSCLLLTPNQMHKQQEIEMKPYKTKNSYKKVLATV
jgi:putative transposase